jgi:hypothetical protein
MLLASLSGGLVSEAFAQASRGPAGTERFRPPDNAFEVWLDKDLQMTQAQPATGLYLFTGKGGLPMVVLQIARNPTTLVWDRFEDKNQMLKPMANTAVTIIQAAAGPNVRITAPLVQLTGPRDAVATFTAIGDARTLAYQMRYHFEDRYLVQIIAGMASAESTRLAPLVDRILSALSVNAASFDRPLEDRELEQELTLGVPDLRPTMPVDWRPEFGAPKVVRTEREIVLRLPVAFAAARADATVTAFRESLPYIQQRRDPPRSVLPQDLEAPLAELGQALGVMLGYVSNRALASWLDVGRAVLDLRTTAGVPLGTIEVSPASFVLAMTRSTATQDFVPLLGAIHATPPPRLPGLDLGPRAARR